MPYNRDILVAIISAVVTLFAGYASGIFESRVSESQLNTIARKIVDEEDYRKVLINKMKGNKDFKGEDGPPPDPRIVADLLKPSIEVIVENNLNSELRNDITEIKNKLVFVDKNIDLLLAFKSRVTDRNNSNCRVVDGPSNGGHFYCKKNEYVAGAVNYSQNNYTVDMIICCTF
ncbi:hypothetical protein O5O45_06800 [Hahella aquimaris]|uniref:hypothetical protein n=1 Tax=Hahella sp. HNIBRBA332 TaxID=3015983 RepID=UPI00273B5C5C|nr:hypothetical protein [Hahella sp. HNIBRBA332]WLQ15623.1 hypothetical protein O5O45_06800 [Hahella sp. HNIBRBA332]